MDLFGVELHESPIEYEIINGECSYCGSDGDYISFEPTFRTSLVP